MIYGSSEFGLVDWYGSEILLVYLHIHQYFFSRSWVGNFGLLGLFLQVGFDPQINVAYFGTESPLIHFIFHTPLSNPVSDVLLFEIIGGSAGFAGLGQASSLRVHLG